MPFWTKVLVQLLEHRSPCDEAPGAARFCADVNARGGFSADVESADFHASGLSDPALQGFVVCHFIG